MINHEQLKTLIQLPPPGILKNVLVVAMENHVAAPQASAELAREGALVIKVENEQTGGDPARKYLSKEIFTTLNAAKASIKFSKLTEFEYAHERYYGGLSDRVQLLLMADVIIDNRSPTAIAHDPELQDFIKMDKSHPVIYCQIAGYDDQSEAALDVSVQAATGMAITNSPFEQKPLKVGFTVLDIVSGMRAASKIKSYLYALMAGNQSVYQLAEAHHNIIQFKISLSATSILLQVGQYLNYLSSHQEEARHWNRDKFIAPFSFYATQDKPISLGIISDEQFHKFCVEVIKRKDLLQRFPTNQLRLANVEELETELNTIFKTAPSQYWLALCKQHNIACSPVNTIAEALQQPFAQQMITETRDQVRIIAEPDRSQFFPKDYKLGKAPQFNEHEAHVGELLKLQKLYYPDARFSQLRKNVFSMQNSRYSWFTENNRKVVDITPKEDVDHEKKQSPVQSILRSSL